jgi:hypothetical protein
MKKYTRKKPFIRRITFGKKLEVTEFELEGMAKNGKGEVFCKMVNKEHDVGIWEDQVSFNNLYQKNDGSI